jgi:hypothetical protein
MAAHFYNRCGLKIEKVPDWGREVGCGHVPDASGFSSCQEASWIFTIPPLLLTVPLSFTSPFCFGLLAIAFYRTFPRQDWTQSRDLRLAD